MADDVIIRQGSRGAFAQPVVTDSIVFDATDLVRAADEMRGAGMRLAMQMARIIKRGANNIKVDARKRYRAQAGSHGRGHAWRYPNSISYDIGVIGGNVTALIGPDKSMPQGALGNILEFGSANSAPLPHLLPAFNAEVPKTGAQLQLAAIKSVFPT